ncbi:MAG: tetratricopeptide repeat protein [Pseudomonadota bacterium]
MTGFIWVFGAVALICQAAVAHGGLGHAYDRMIAEDFAPEATWAFADQAEAAGDPDAAIAALEQLLVRDPENREAHARMARLYAAVGNDALAKIHRDLAGLAPETQVWGRASVGVAHETNPSAAPSNAIVPIFNAGANAFVQIAAGQERADQLGTVRLDLNMAHGLSETALLAAEVSVNADTYAATEELSSLQIQATVGPWLSTPSLGEGTSIRPFLTAGAGMLDSTPYYGSLGAGVVVNLPLSETLALSVLTDLTYANYSATIFNGFDGDTLDNLLVRGGGQLGGSVGSVGYSVYAFLGYAAADAEEESYLSLRGGALAYTAIPGAEEMLGMPVTLQIGTKADWFAYSEANPVIDPTQSREDFWLGGQGALILGLTDDLDLTIGADYVRRFSNIELFDSQNLRVFMELGVDF